MSLQLCFKAPWALELAVADRRPARRAHLTARPLERREGIQGTIPVVRDMELHRGTGRARQCSTFARARTVNLKRLGVKVRQAAHTKSLFQWDVDVSALRPKTRADCIDGPRPCPWIGCRYHLAITADPDRESVKETFPEMNILSDPEGPGLQYLEEIMGTCALDIADKHDDGTQGIGGLIALYQAASSGKPIGQTPGMTIEETGRVLNISVERTRQIASSAMQTMRVKLRRFG